MRLKKIRVKSSLVLIIGLLLFMMTEDCRAQTQLFSFTQYMNNLTPLNPAYSLLDRAGSVNTTVREQWAGVEGAPKTFLFNGNLPLETINSSTGLIILDDKFSIENQIEANVYFAKKIQTGQKNYLGVSLNAGIRNYVANYSLLDASDPVFKDNVHDTKPNVGFGIIYYSDWYYLGISVPEFTVRSLGKASLQNATDFKNTYYLSGALITNSSDDIKLKPAALFCYANGVPVIADVSFTIYMKGILGVGMGYRTNKEMTGILTVNINAFQIGYSYQSGTSPENLGNFNVSTHEVTLSYRFGKWASSPKML